MVVAMVLWLIKVFKIIERRKRDLYFWASNNMICCIIQNGDYGICIYLTFLYLLYIRMYHYQDVGTIYISAIGFFFFTTLTITGIYNTKDNCFILGAMLFFQKNHYSIQLNYDKIYFSKLLINSGKNYNIDPAIPNKLFYHCCSKEELCSLEECCFWVFLDKMIKNKTIFHSAKRNHWANSRIDGYAREKIILGNNVKLFFLVNLYKSLKQIWYWT
jgi:hypothetical protein